jgi:hypothetical protein
MALRASTRPRAAPGDGPCANVRCRNRGHSPVRGTIHGGPTWLASCSRAARSARPAGQSARSRAFSAGDHHGRFDVLWGGAAATSRGENARSQKANTHRHIPCPTVVRFDAAGVVPNRSGERLVAGATASSGVRPPREVPNRLRPSHQPSRVEGASCCGPQGGSFEASTRASSRRGGGDQGPEAMIASRT